LSANFGTGEALIAVMKYFRDRGINLKESAQNFLARRGMP